MRTIKVLRTPEDVLKHKAAKGGDVSVPEAVEEAAPADPPPPPPPANPPSSDPPANPAPANPPTETLEQMVERLKEENKADALDAIAESLGLEVSGNKTEVATAIAMKQLGIEESE